MTTKPRLNILFIMADQMTPFLTGAYNHPVVKTPHLNQLADEGVRFDNAYSPCPLCTPARASMMTGKYISEIGAYDNAAPLPVDEPTLAHYLSAAEYDTVVSGKLHYVGPDQLHGFQRRLTTDVYPEEFDWLPRRDTVRPEVFKRPHAIQYIKETIEEGLGKWNAKLSYDEETQFRAVEYLRAKGRQKREVGAIGQEFQPFFLKVSFHHPHSAFFPPQEYWDLYAGAEIDLPELPDNLSERYSLQDQWLNAFHGTSEVDWNRPDSIYMLRRAYYALVTYIDDKVGQLLRVLAENGFSDDTLVIFTSDHGDMLLEKGMVQKRIFYEWSSRVPLIIRFPDRSYRGMKAPHLVSLIDLPPTILDYVGIHDLLPMDGQSVLSLLDGSEETPRSVFSEYHAEGVPGTSFMIRSGSYKYVYIRDGDQEDAQLFDLQSDPDEWDNLVGQAEYASLVADLKSQILARFDPDAIEMDVRASLQRRALIKRALQFNKTTWDYYPMFDARRDTLGQYLP